MSEVTDKDRGYQALFKRLDGKRRVLTVGFHGPEAATVKQPAPGEEPSKLTVGDVATIHEFGLGVPERSMIRGWADASEGQNNGVLKRIGESVIKGVYSADTGLERAGVLFVAQIQARMVAGIPPALEASTIARKGSSVPLINTGQMKSSILFKVKIG